MNIVKNISLLTLSLLSALYSSSVYSMEHAAASMNIFEAAKEGDIVRFQECLRDGANVNQLDKIFRTSPLHWAAIRGHIAIVQACIDNGANLEQEGGPGHFCPLLFAVLNDHITIVQLLLDCGVDINQQTNLHETPLQVAAKKDNIAMVKLLLDRGANINPEDFYGKIPLHWAAANGYIAVVQELIKNSSYNINPPDIDGLTPLQHAQSYGHRAMVALLTDYQQRIKVAQQRVHNHLIAHTLAMATHNRLGTESPLALLDQALLCYISKLTEEAESHDAREPRQQTPTTNSRCIIS